MENLIKTKTETVRKLSSFLAFLGLTLVSLFFIFILSELLANTLLGLNVLDSIPYFLTTSFLKENNVLIATLFAIGLIATISSAELKRMLKYYYVELQKTKDDNK